MTSSGSTGEGRRRVAGGGRRVSNELSRPAQQSEPDRPAERTGQAGSDRPAERAGQAGAADLPWRDVWLRHEGNSSSDIAGGGHSP